MIKVVLTRDADGYPAGYTMEGHADFADAGQDIVCAAVSALAQTTMLGLERQLGLQLEVTIENGYFACQLPGDMSPEEKEKAALLVETMREGLKEISRVYPKRVRVQVR